MKHLSGVILTIAVPALLASTATAVRAQSAPPAGPGATAPTAQAGADRAPSPAEVEAELAAIDGDGSLNDTEKAFLRQELQKAMESLTAVANLTAQAEAYRQTLQSGPDEAARLRSQLESAEPSSGPVPVEIPDGIDELRAEVGAQQARLTLLRDELAAVRGELARIEARPLEVSARVPEVQRELAAARDRVDAAQPAEPTTEARTRGQLLALKGREAQLAAELEMLQLEQQSQSIRRDVLRARQALLERQVELAESTFNKLAAAANQRLANTAERVRSVARQVPDELAAGSPEIRALADEIMALADELDRAIVDSDRATSATSRIRQGLDSLTAELSSIREQLRLADGGRAMVQVLFALDTRSADARDELAALVVPPLEQARLSSLLVRERLEQQPQVAAAFTEPRPPALDELLQARQTVLVELEQKSASLVQTLALLEQRKQEYLDLAATVRAYIAEQLFGFGLKACPAIGRDTLTGLPAAVSWQLRPAHWHELALRSRSAVVRMPATTFAVALAILVLILRRRRIIDALEATGTRLRHTSTVRYRTTLEALLWTVLLALPAPLGVVFAGWSLLRAPGPSDWMLGLTFGLQSAGWMLLSALFFAAVLRPRGLGTGHFGWREPTVDRLRRAILALAAVYLPAWVVTLSCSYGDASEHFESLGRVSFIAAHLWMAFVVFGLLLSRSKLPETDGDSQDRPLLARWRTAWSVLLLAAPLAIVAVAMVGYLISALMLSLGLIVTLSLVGAGAVVQGLALSWLRMRQRKLALAEALERRRVRREAAAARDGSVGASEVIEVEAEVDAAPDLDAVAGQTRDVVEAVVGLATLLAILAYWSHAVPLAELASQVTIPLTGGLTLLRLSVAVLIAVVSFILVRNLPGLLELVVLRTTELQPGTRYAVTTLCQYGLTALGAAIALGVLEIDWVKFGWIAAALSVGLGFGLQEVVANFVCGLILLFERPLRVGDIVTVENMTGTVTDIRMRATTITNWDRQEFVVPNKTLITSTLLNWTLSATVNRIVLPVGVAYGSDTDLARRLLLEVAADHPEIMDEPAPMATFEQFADSSLNLVLRAFLPNLDNRLATITELHTEIARRFEAAGITIAFPQLDLHLHTDEDVPSDREAR
ncbi:MAG: mechanosensitive ion channel [Holophagae bacterium]|jgi:potassium efflux system protein